MAKAKKENWAKCKVWGVGHSMEIEGPTLGCALEVFGMLPAEKRVQALELMKQRDEKLKQLEAERDAKKVGIPA